VSKVEYSIDGGEYKTGTSFSSTTAFSRVDIRITDSAGNVTNWVYNGTGVVRAY